MASVSSSALTSASLCLCSYSCLTLKARIIDCLAIKNPQKCRILKEFIRHETPWYALRVTQL